MSQIVPVTSDEMLQKVKELLRSIYLCSNWSMMGRRNMRSRSDKGHPCGQDEGDAHCCAAA